VNDKSIVDVDEEGQLLLPTQAGEVNSFQLCCCSNVGLKLSTLTDATVIHCLRAGGEGRGGGEEGEWGGGGGGGEGGGEGEGGGGKGGLLQTLDTLQEHTRRIKFIL